MKKGDKVRVLKTSELGVVEHVQWRSSSGSCVSYISKIQIILSRGEKIYIEDCRLIELVDG